MILKNFGDGSRRKERGMAKIRSAWGPDVEVIIPGLNKFEEGHITNVAKVAERYSMTEASQLLTTIAWMRLREDGKG